MSEESLIREKLTTGFVEIIFNKKDGSRRVMKATLNKEFIDLNAEQVDKKTDRVVEPIEGLLRVFDAEKNEWRSILVENIISVRFIENYHEIEELVS